ncbi:hypothetical protein Tco_1392673 [Tanacetum coccineum]
MPMLHLVDYYKTNKTRRTVPPQHDPKDKGKAKMVKPKKPFKRKDQIKFDEELAARLQEQVQEELTIEERSKMFVELMDKRKKHFARLRAEEQRRKPLTKAQKRDQICTFLKNMAGFTHNQLKNKNFEEIQKAFDKTINWINSFVSMDSKVVEGNKDKVEGKIVPYDDKAINFEPLTTKSPIVDWKTQILGEEIYYQIKRADGSYKMYKIFYEMLNDFKRQDLIDLYRLVTEMFKITRPEGSDRLLWGDLTTIFEPSDEDELWRNQQDYTLIRWELYDSCGVYSLSMDTVYIHMLGINEVQDKGYIGGRYFGNFVMSDSEDSTVTYTEVSSPFKDLSDIGSLRVDGLPMMLEDPYVEAALQASPSLNYVPGSEHPPSPVYVPYVLEPLYPRFMPPEDDDPEDDDEDLEEDPADYPTDRDDEVVEEEEPSEDDADDEEEDEDEDEEEDEHLALADFVPPPACHTTARMSIRDQTSIPFPPAAEVDRFLAISTPPPSPLTSYSSPLPHIPSPPLPVSLPLPVSPSPLPASPTYSLGYRAAMIRLRAESLSNSHILLPSPIVLPHTRASVAMMRVVAPSTYILATRSETLPSGAPPLLPIPLPTPSPPLLLPSTVCRAGVFEVTLLPQKRLCIALGPRFEFSERSSAPTARPTRGFRADYGFVSTLDDKIRRDPEREVGYRITDTWDEMVEDMQETPAATDMA